MWNFLLKICVKVGFLAHAQDGEDLFSNLSDDIIFDILVRLPAEDLLRDKLVCLRWYRLITSKRFVNVHTTKTNSKMSLIMFDGTYPEPAAIFRMDHRSNTPRKYDMSHAAEYLPICAKKFRASCNGLVVLRSEIDNSIFLVFNVLTREFVEVIIEDNVCGFIFDKSTDEYKLILHCSSLNNKQRVRYSLYGLKTKITTRIGIHYYVPQIDYTTVYISDAAYWLVSDANKIAHMMMYKYDSEDIIVKPLPSVQPYETRLYAHKRRLLNVDDTLVYIEYFFRIVKMWTLEDLTTPLWVPGKVINLPTVFSSHLTKPIGYGDLDVLDIQDGELLLKWPEQGMFWYNLRSKTVRKIKIDSSIIDSMLGVGFSITDEMLEDGANGLSCLKTLVSPKQIVM